MRGPGIPRPRLARVLRRRNNSDAARAADMLVVGAVSALALLILCAPVAALAAAIVCALGAVWLGLRIARRNAVLAVLAEDGGGDGVVGDGDGEHSPKVTKRGALHEADR